MKKISPEKAQEDTKEFISTEGTEDTEKNSEFDSFPISSLCFLCLLWKSPFSFPRVLLRQNLYFNKHAPDGNTMGACECRANGRDYAAIVSAPSSSS